MSMGTSDDVEHDRTRLNFADAAIERFRFLGGLGFALVESSLTLVRYAKGELEAHVYHGRRSYEIGFEVARGGDRYTISELIRATDSEAAARYRNYVATTAEEIAQGLTQLEGLVKRFGVLALRGEPEFFATLASQRKRWAEGFELDVLAGQLRPKADAAFRSGGYREAAELYERILPRLSAAELKRLAIAKKRAGL